jgi:hypothetical protein
LLTSDKYNISKITLERGVKKLVIGSNRAWKLRQINLVQVILEAHDNDSNNSTSTRQQRKWISSLFVSSGILTQVFHQEFTSGV